MAVYEAVGSEGYELCHPADGDFEKIKVEINGTPRAKSWRPIAVEVVRKEDWHERDRWKESDSPWLGGHALIFRERAIEAMGDMLRLNGELLPLECAGASLFIYNPTRLLDALDEKASTIMRFNDGRIMWVKNYVFRPEVVGEMDVFKIPNLRVSPSFLSQRFVDRWREKGLLGLDFKLIWEL